MSDTEAVAAAGGVLFKEEEQAAMPGVVLIFRRGVWDLPKGKVEEGETVRECAVREVAEEIGFSEYPHIVSSLSETYHEYERNDTRFGKTTHWFAMTCNDWFGKDFEPETAEGIEEVRWVSLDQAFKLVGYENLVEVLTSFYQWYRSR